MNLKTLPKMVIMMTAFFSIPLAWAAAKTAGCPVGDSCVVVKPQGKIMLAPMVSTTGSGEQTGHDDARGLYLANRHRLQVLGHEVKFLGNPGDEIQLENGIAVPNWDDAVNAAGKANAIIQNSDIVAVLGTTLSGAGATTIPIFSTAKYLMVSPQNQGALLTQNAPNPTFYARTIPTGILQAEGLAEFVCKSGMSIATLHDGNAAFTKTLAQKFSDKCTSLGATDIFPGGAQVQNPVVQPNFDNKLGEILTANGGNPPDLLYISLTGAAANGTAVQYIRTYQGDTFESTLLTETNSALSDAMWKSANNDGKIHAEGVLVSTYNFDFDVNPNNPSDQPNSLLAKFYRDYDSVFGILVPDRIPPTDTEYPPYNPDAYNIVLDAIQKVAILAPGGDLLIPRVALKDALIYDTVDVQGLSGILNCNKPSAGGQGPNFVGDCNTDIETMIVEVQCSSDASCAFIPQN